MPVTMPGGRRLVVVEVPRGERRELEERRAGVEQLLDPLADRQLALLAMPLQVRAPAALADRGGALPQLRDEGGHRV